MENENKMRDFFLIAFEVNSSAKSLKRDLTISDVAFAQQNENKLSFAFAYSQHCSCNKDDVLG